MNIKILEEAEKDIEEGYSFYELQYSGLGTYFLDSLYSDIDSLSYFAGIHQVVFGLFRDLCGFYPSLWQREVRRDFINNASLL